MLHTIAHGVSRWQSYGENKTPAPFTGQVLAILRERAYHVKHPLDAKSKA